MDDVPHLSLPLRIVGQTYADVQQDTLDELVACVACVAQFPIGSRVESPDFGVPSLEFTDRPLDTLALEDAIALWEPRATVAAVELPYDPTDPTAAPVRLEVSMSGETGDDRA